MSLRSGQIPQGSGCMHPEREKWRGDQGETANAYVVEIALV